MTEKRKPHHDLLRIKARFSTPANLSITATASKGAVSLGYDRQAVVDVIQGMTGRMFYKSMTTLADHQRWQDVYHVPQADGLVLYVKFTDDVITEFTVVSFKEK